MKKFAYIFAIFAIIAIYTKSNAQALNDIFNRYSGQEGFTSISLSDLSFMDIDIGTIDNVKILTYESSKKKNIEQGKQFALDLKNLRLNLGEEYKEFMSINDDDSYVRMLYKKTNSIIKEFLMYVIGTDGESTLIWISGDLDLENIGEIGKMFNKDIAKKGYLK